MPKATQPNTTPDPQLAAANARTRINIAAFLAVLMGPIPESEEQADTPEFRKQHQKDLLKIWEAGKARLRTIGTLRKAECIKDWRSKEAQRLLTEYNAERWRQCLLMSPTEKELRWKKREAQEWRRPPDNVLQAIALDEKRFAGGVA